MDSNLLVHAASSVPSIREFVLGDGLREAVAAVVGDVHMHAAKVALEASKLSADPVARVNSAITHLEAAHSAFSQVHRDWTSFASRTFKAHSLEKAAIKDRWACCLMALCYVARNDKLMALDSLAKAKKADEVLDFYWNDTTDPGLVTPSVVRWTLSALTSSTERQAAVSPDKLPPKFDFNQFCRHVQSVWA